MSTTKGSNTPGGTPTEQSANPPFNKAGSMDSGVSQPLHYAFERSSLLPRSPVKTNSEAIQQGIENAELRKRLSEIEKLTTQLSNEIARLTKENEQLRNAQKTEDLEMPQATNGEGGLDFHTDEEDLERETNWMLKETKKRKRPLKKRKAESSPEMTEVSKINDNKLKTRIEPKEKPLPTKEKAPPPINIIGVTNYSEIQTIIKSVTNEEYKVVALNNNVWKINTPDPETYRALATKLNEERKEWYTYENKNDRPIKVMARGLHPTCSKEDIIEDLQQKGLQIQDAVNIIKREKIGNGQESQIIKKGLPLFMLTFDKKENVENVFKINSILHMRVKIEPLKKNSRLIPQCKKCQGYNHTQKYCWRQPRCVRCAGKHNATSCTESRNTPAKCINCKGQHPANYRGCEVAKELQRLRNKTRQPPQRSGITIDGKSHKLQVEPKPAATRVDPRKTFSQIVQQRSNDANDSVLERIFRSIETLNERLAKQERGLEALHKRLDNQTTANEIAALIY